MGNWVNYWFWAFFLMLLLSVPCVAGLILCWHEVEPETTEEWKITRAGKRLHRARLWFTAGCVAIFASLCLLGAFMGSLEDSRLFHWCDLHRECVPVLMVLSTGLFGVSFFCALNSTGDGRRIVLVASVAIAAFTLLAALSLMPYFQ